MSCGGVVITTGYGGPLTFLNANNSFPIPVGRFVCFCFYFFYDADYHPGGPVPRTSAGGTGSSRVIANDAFGCSESRGAE